MDGKSRLCIWLAALCCVLVWAAVLAGFSHAGGVEMEAMRVKVSTLQARVEELETQSSEAVFSARVQEAEASRRLKEARAAAALTPVRGAGLRVELVPRASLDQTAMDTDLLRLVNELRSSGAEAIAINGERLAARSAIRSVGQTVLMHGKIFTAPFTVDAIGNGEVLENALKLYHGVAYLLEQRFTVRITRLGDLTLQAYSGPSSFEYAVAGDPP